MRKGDDNVGNGMITAGKRDIHIPAGQTKGVKCRVRARLLPNQEDDLFEPSPYSLFPQSLSVEQGVVSLQRGSSSFLTIPVTNSTAHNIKLYSA